MFKDLEVDEEMGKEMDRRKQTMSIKRDVMEKIQKYNSWVDEVREKNEQWRPKQPEFGRKVPFAKSDFYLMTSEKDYEKYPELARMEREAEKQDEVEEDLGKYFKNK